MITTVTAAPTPTPGPGFWVALIGVAGAVALGVVLRGARRRWRARRRRAAELAALRPPPAHPVAGPDDRPTQRFPTLTPTAARRWQVVDEPARVRPYLRHHPPPASPRSPRSGSGAPGRVPRR